MTKLIFSGLVSLATAEAIIEWLKTIKHYLPNGTLGEIWFEDELDALEFKLRFL